MKAVYYEEFGTPEVLKVGQRPVPEPGPGQVLVETAAAAVNPIDRRLRSGELQDFFEREFPIIPGWDIAGRIAKAGPDVNDWQVGDPVVALAFTWFLHHGTYAEYALVNVDALARKPDVLSFTQAASLPLVSLTAWQSLVEFSGLKAGQSVLIQAGAGGLGSAAIPIAKHLGAKVYTTASASNHAYVKERGADHAIDYRTEDYGEVLRAAEPEGVDVVLESLEDPVSIEKAIHLVKPGGAVAYMNNEPPEIPGIREKGINTAFFHHRADGAMLGDLMTLYSDGTLPLPRIETIALDDAVEAHRRSESWQTDGKLVFDIASV